MAKKNPAKLKKVKVSLPFGLGSAEWEEDASATRAAWALYVELVTRIAVEPLGEDKGVLREALTSLNSLFGTTRQILKEAGPAVGVAPDSLGGVAIAVLNKGLRPFLEEWHPALEEWETQNTDNLSRALHEKRWEKEADLRAELKKLRAELEVYAKALADFAGIELST